MSIEELEKAVCRGNLDWIRRVIQQEGVDVNTRLRSNTTTVLHTAARSIRPNSSAVIVRLLLEHGADVTAKDNNDKTPLHCALDLGVYDDATTHVLLDYNAPVCGITKYRKTPLHYALESGAGLDVVRRIIVSDRVVVDVNPRDCAGRTPIHWVIHKPVTAPVMELLLSHHIDIYAQDYELKTPLHALVRTNSTDAVKVLLRHLKSCNKMMDSVLLCAMAKNRLPFHDVRSLEMAQALLEQLSDDDDDDLVVVPRACPTMLSARDHNGQTLVDHVEDGTLLHDYLVSYTDFPVAVAARRAVRINPLLNEFQHSLVEAFRNKWDGWSILDDYCVTTTTFCLPDDLKYPIMAYLSVEDIMKMCSTTPSPAS